MEVAPDVVAEHAGKTQEHQQHAIDENGFLAAPAKCIHTDGQNVFKHRQHRGHAREHHEEEEQRAPEAAARHVDKHLRQRDEEEGGAIVGRNAVGEACGEDDRTGHERNEGVERADADGLTGEGVVIGHVAAEDLHRRNAEREREEGLIHRIGDEAAQTVFTDGIEGGEQIELHALCRAGKRQAVNGENENEREQRNHHDLGYALKALLQTQRTDDKADDDDGDRQNAHFNRIGQQLAEHGGRVLRRHAVVELAGQEPAKIAHHPAGNRRVVHHQEVAADQAEPAVDVPLRLGLFERLVGEDRALAARAADGQLHRQHGNAHDEQAQNVKENKIAAAVFARHIGEAPDIADADGAARADEQEAQAGAERFAFHVDRPHL